MAPTTKTSKTGKTRRPHVMNAKPLIWPIRSQSDPARRYNVRLPECGYDGEPCGDYLYRHELGQAPFCKHIIVAFLQYMGMDAVAATNAAPAFKALFDGIAEAVSADSEDAAVNILTIALASAFSR